MASVSRIVCNPYKMDAQVSRAPKLRLCAEATLPLKGHNTNCSCLMSLMCLSACNAHYILCSIFYLCTQTIRLEYLIFICLLSKQVNMVIYVLLYLKNLVAVDSPCSQKLSSPTPNLLGSTLHNTAMCEMTCQVGPLGNTTVLLFYVPFETTEN